VVGKFRFSPLVVFLTLCGLGFADQITLSNGDRLTGTIVKSDGKTLVFHSAAAGDLTLKFSDIQEIKSDAELYVTLKNGQTAVGPVSTVDESIQVATKSGPVRAPKDDIKLVRNDEEEAKYQRLLHPGLLHGWEGGLNVGFSVARGNSQTESLALAFNADHPTLNDKITLYASALNTTNNLATPSTVANLTTGGIRYDRNITDRVFVFVSADYMANALQFLDLRQVYTGGFGYHVIKNDRTVFDVFGGPNYTHETYSNGDPIPGTIPVVFASYGKTNRFAALTLGETLGQKLGKTTALTQAFNIFPNLQQTGQYRWTFSLATVTKINKWLGWQNQFNDIYVSNPPPATKNNDLVFTTGLNIAFAH
jgi:putative salt-induced outer membrane protein